MWPAVATFMKIDIQPFYFTLLGKLKPCFKFNHKLRKYEKKHWNVIQKCSNYFSMNTSVRASFKGSR